jgi:hypothetical protein
VQGADQGEDQKPDTRAGYMQRSHRSEIVGRQKSAGRGTKTSARPDYIEGMLRDIEGVLRDRSSAGFAVSPSPALSSPAAW